VVVAEVLSHPFASSSEQTHHFNWVMGVGQMRSSPTLIEFSRLFVTQPGNSYSILALAQLSCIL